MTDGSGTGSDHSNWLSRFFSHLGGSEAPDPTNSPWPTSTAPVDQVRERLRSSEWGPGSDRTPTAGVPRNQATQFPTGRHGIPETNRGSYPT